MGETIRKGVSGLTGAGGAGPAVSFCIQLSATPRHHNHQHNQDNYNHHNHNHQHNQRSL